MSKQEELISSFKTTNWLITKFSDGLTHEDSLVSPQFRANTFNWVLGHILVSRDRALSLLSQKPILSEQETELYQTGSEPANMATATAPRRGPAYSLEDGSSI